MPRPLVLLHGLGRTARSLWVLERDARHRGYDPLPIGYPSLRARIPELAEYVAERLDRELGGAQFDAVTHSMGGVVLRAAVAAKLVPAKQVHRAVMLGPPSQGSEIAELLRNRWWFRALAGPAATQLGTALGSEPLRLPPASFPLGVIAGSLALNPLARWVFAAPSDGKVAIARTHVPGMTDFVVVRCSHTWLVRCPSARRAAFEFLERGRFDRTAPTD